MFQIIICLIFFYILQAHAEESCHFVLNTQWSSMKNIGSPTDVQEVATTTDSEIHCRTFYRINIDDRWRTATGSATGRSKEEACSKALSLGNSQLLSDLAPDTLRSTTEMICSDFEDIPLRSVKLGDQIWESNVDIASNPKERNYFHYKGSRCRKFSEKTQMPQGLYLAQGVICRMGQNPNARWLVVDKY